jgi:TolB protein
MAASRVVFRRRGSAGNDLMIVDSDGENLRRLTSAPMLLSPGWSADGGRLIYATSPDGSRWSVEVRELASGRSSTVAEAGGLLLTPAFSADGGRVAFARPQGGGMRIYSSALDGSGARQMTSGPRDDLSPSYSPGGDQIAFMSSRLGQPHIYMMDTDGGGGTLLSPFVYGEPGYYTSPDWAPTGSLVAFHGRSRGQFQIMVADAARPGATVQQITADGSSEDPSWAPDARHIVFSGYRSGPGWGLYVVDAVSGRVRPLVSGRSDLPDWGPSL